MKYFDRRSAGRELAKKLLSYRGRSGLVVIGLMRGGLVVASEIAKALHLPLAPLMVAKIGAPYNPELGCGAICGDRVVFNRQLIGDLQIPEDYLEKELEREGQELKKRNNEYKNFSQISQKEAIVIDDGIATGMTMMAAIEYLKAEKIEVVEVAAPVASAEAVEKFQGSVPHQAFLQTPELFSGINSFYENFLPIDEKEIKNILEGAGWRSS